MGDREAKLGTANKATSNRTRDEIISMSIVLPRQKKDACGYAG